MAPVDHDKRSVRIYKDKPENQMTASEAASYLATGLMPEHIVVKVMSKESREAYFALDGNQRLKRRRGRGNLTIAVGHLVLHEVIPGRSTMFNVWDGWEPIHGLDLNVSPYDWDMHHAGIEASARILIGVGGLGRDSEDTRWLLHALTVASEVAIAAENKVMITRASKDLHEMAEAVMNTSDALRRLDLS
jgi:hypothetical protein